MRSILSGFTLVEILVVIGIIAVLIAILLPTLNAARESAARTKCLSNVRQIAITVIAYCNDNKGTFPALASGKNEAAGNSPEILHWQLDNAAGVSTMVFRVPTFQCISTGGEADFKVRL
jgi:prepilin-type N-terminal cleavage/methylation domain-containing protein